MDNQTFVTMASSSNSFEIAAGAMARDKGQSQDVVRYGEHMVNEHGAVGVEMTALAQRKGWTVASTLVAKEQANLIH